jgi:hypothetical protein
VDTYFGVLQSSFIVGLSISMPVFANLVHSQVLIRALSPHRFFYFLFIYLNVSYLCRQPPFLLVGIGLAVWCASAFVAGLAQAANSYTLLFLGRMLSGVGEASFQVD